MRQANTLEARKVVRNILKDDLRKGFNSTWTDEGAEGRRVCMALDAWLSDEEANVLANELNFWMRLSGYTNKVTVTTGRRGRSYVRFAAQIA